MIKFGMMISGIYVFWPAKYYGSRQRKVCVAAFFDETMRLAFTSFRRKWCWPDTYALALLGPFSLWSKAHSSGNPDINIARIGFILGVYLRVFIATVASVPSVKPGFVVVAGSYPVIQVYTNQLSMFSSGLACHMADEYILGYVFVYYGRNYYWWQMFHIGIEPLERLCSENTHDALWLSIYIY